MVPCTPSLADFLELSRGGNLVPIFREIIADTETPVSAFLKTARGEHAFLLESVVGGDKWGRYSFLGSEPAAVFTSRGTTISLAEEGKSLKTFTADDPLAALRDLLTGYRAVPVAGLPRFFGGAVGYLAYDAVRFFERLPATLPDPLGVPELYFIVPASMLVFDTVAQSIKVVVNVDLRDPGTDPHAAYEAAVVRVDELVARLAAPLTLREALPTTGEALPVTANMTPKEFGAIVERAKEYIRAGDIIQVVLAQRLEAKLRAAPFNVYRALRTVNPSPYMFYLKLGEQTLVGSSPEVMARVEDGELTVRPIAGTSPRGTQEMEDRELERALLADPKEIAEHIMLLDLGRNDVGRVSTVGSVEVTERLVIERYSHVMHIVSNVRGSLAEGRDCFDAFRATFPAGTLSGAPKIRAMQIIEELEPVRRGVYGGAVGYFGFGGAMDTCIAIRTMLIKDGMVYIQAGAGIVADSDPEREHAECLNKARGLLQALKRAEHLWGADVVTRRAPKILMVDNYDSFTYNLVQYLGELGAEVDVRRNDAVTVEEIAAMHPDGIVVSPGPCTPKEAGVSVPVIERFRGEIPILGVCLGHQAIGAALGGAIVRAPRIMHGKTSPIHHDGRGVFRGLSNPFDATRYHSLVIDPGTLPADLEVSAWTAEGEIMGVRHRALAIEGVQFHPESILTLEGKQLLKNFLDGLPAR